MLSVKAREAAGTIFKVFGMTQLTINRSLPCLIVGERSTSNYKATNQYSITTLSLHHERKIVAKKLIC